LIFSTFSLLRELFGKYIASSPTKKGIESAVISLPKYYIDDREREREREREYLLLSK
jgi:hypothetical protein